MYEIKEEKLWSLFRESEPEVSLVSLDNSFDIFKRMWNPLAEHGMGWSIFSHSNCRHYKEREDIRGIMCFFGDTPHERLFCPFCGDEAIITGTMAFPYNIEKFMLFIPEFMRAKEFLFCGHDYCKESSRESTLFMVVIPTGKFSQWEEENIKCPFCKEKADIYDGGMVGLVNLSDEKDVC